MPLLTGGELLVASLVAQDATLAFGVPGESYLAVLDALVDVADRLRFVVCRNEGGAAYAAEAYGKLTGRPGLALVTPAATTGVVGGCAFHARDAWSNRRLRRAEASSAPIALSSDSQRACTRANRRTERCQCSAISPTISRRRSWIMRRWAKKSR